MQRRSFIALLGGAAFAWPLAARAQQGERMRRIGIIGGAAADNPDAQAQQAAFLQGLQQLGWIDGRNMRIESRWTGGNPAKARQYAAELIALGPDVIFASGSSALDRCSRRAARCRSYSRASPTRSALASSIVWRGRAATRPALCFSNTVCAGSGWRCLRKSCLA